MPCHNRRKPHQIIYQNVPNLFPFLNLVVFSFSFEACAVKLTQFSSTRWFPDRSRFVIFTSKRCQKDVKMPCLYRHKTSPSCCPWKRRYRSTYFWWYIWEKDPSLGTKGNILTKIVYFLGDFTGCRRYPNVIGQMLQ